MAKSHVISLPLLSDLRNQMGDNNTENIVVTTGQDTVRDGKGRFYGWDPTSTEAEDPLIFNVVKPNALTNAQAGRWKAIFVRKLVLPHGILVINSGVKKFYCNTVTNASSEATINLTMDNTTNGIAIFSNILWDDSKANTNITNVNDMVSSCRKLLSANMKQLTHVFARGNNTALSVLGVNILSFRAATQNTPVTFIVEGE